MFETLPPLPCLRVFEAAARLKSFTAPIEGMGVALGRRSLAIDDRIAGHLVRPFGAAVPSGFAYYPLHPRHAAQWPKVSAFRAWLRAEARLMPALPAPLR